MCTCFPTEASASQSAASHSPLATDGSQVLTANELVALAIHGLGLETTLLADEALDKDEMTVVTATHALVNRIETAAHAS
jgi:hypothetical protein